MAGTTDASGELERRIMNASPEQLALLEDARAHGLMELAPVVLPVNPLGDNNHMGWPVATAAGDAIVVIHRRIPGHNPKGAGRGGADLHLLHGDPLDRRRRHLEPVVRSARRDGRRAQPRRASCRCRTATSSGRSTPAGRATSCTSTRSAPPTTELAARHRGGALQLRCVPVGRRRRHLGTRKRAVPGRHHPGDIVYLGPRIIDHPGARPAGLRQHRRLRAGRHRGRQLFPEPSGRSGRPQPSVPGGAPLR